MGARAITRLLLGFFEVVPAGSSLTCALASGHEELMREIWVHSPDEVRARCIGTWLKSAAALQLEVPFHWLLGMADEAGLDRAVEMMVEDRLVGALCEVESTGFDFTRTRSARALSRWSRTRSLVTIPTPSLPTVPASTFLAWHLRALGSWDIPCDEPEAIANGRVEWGDPAPRMDVSSFTKSHAKRVLFVGQKPGGVVFGAFANCPLARGVRGRDPDLRSAICVLEHPTGEQRKWQLQNPNCIITVSERFVWFGAGFCVDAFGYLHCGLAAEFGMTEADTGFVSLKPVGNDGWSLTPILRWELWSV
jgi:hypothetical protein